ncbi:helix-turn-helix domain containing protein [Mycobacteroides abscessus]|uniref:helix-turn-helix domain containing protein n=1 Tax=Mycobacteroides abscessus TaxID=36809 RepID=UPI0019D2861D|nr:helix-turn-helix domain containing protein [Mycobacteroides abscessus]MBN7451024.1 helix-turn-helix domain containing protein [Mycobacteroides abscessus subsp. abscessus]
MSEVAVVDEHEVEVLRTITLDEAEQMAAEIRELAAVARDGFEKLTHAVKEAKATNICQVLGYRSWPEFIEAQFGGKIEVHGSARQEVMAFLAGEGMGVRSIAAITTSSKSTVSRVLNQVSQSGTAESDGTEAVAEEQVSHNGTAESEGTVPEYTHGRDDKKYPKPKPRKKPEPKPVDEKPADAAPAARAVQIPTAYREIVGGFTRPIEDLFALTRDPRWAKAVQRFNLKDRDTLDRTIDGLQEFRAAMNKQPEEQNPPTPAAEVEEVATTSVPVEPEVVQQVTATPTPARRTNCDRCNVDLPASATEPLCDDCDGAPEAPAPDATVEPPAVVVHNEAISKRSHQRRRFSGRKVTA